MTNSLLQDLAEVMRFRDQVSSSTWTTMTGTFVHRHHAAIEQNARDAETERAIQSAAEKLPDGYVITLYIEKNSGYIDLTGPDGDPVSIETADRSLAEQIVDATRTAIDAAMKGEDHA